MRGYVTKVLTLLLTLIAIPTFSYVTQHKQIDKQTLEQLLNAQTQQINTNINTIRQNLITEYNAVKNIMEELSKKLLEIQEEIQINKEEQTLNNQAIQEKLQELETIKQQLAQHSTSLNDVVQNQVQMQLQLDQQTTSLNDITQNQTQMQQENQQLQQMILAIQNDLQHYKKNVTRRLVTIMSTAGSLGASLFLCWNIPLLMWLIIPATISGATYMGCDAYYAYQGTQQFASGRFLKWIITFYIKQKLESLKQRSINTVISIKDFLKRLFYLQTQQPGKWERVKNFFNSGLNWTSQQAQRLYSFLWGFIRQS